MHLECRLGEAQSDHWRIGNIRLIDITGGEIWEGSDGR